MNWSDIDNSATNLINGMAGSPAVDELALAITTYGALAIVGAVAIRWWWHRPEQRARERYLAILSGGSVALGLAINQVVILFIHRVRPYDVGLTHVLIPHSADPSFPSDHATLGFAVAFALLASGARRGWFFLLAAFLLAGSRVYVGTHYVSDVLGGLLTAGLAVAACLCLLRSDSVVVRAASRIL